MKKSFELMSNAKGHVVTDNVINALCENCRLACQGEMSCDGPENCEAMELLEGVLKKIVKHEPPHTNGADLFYCPKRGTRIFEDKGRFWCGCGYEYKS